MYYDQTQPYGPNDIPPPSPPPDAAYPQKKKESNARPAEATWLFVTLYGLPAAFAHSFGFDLLATA